MTLLNVERIKLFSTRSPYWCLALIVVIGLVITLVSSLVENGQFASLSSSQQWIGFGQSVVMVMAALAITTEYRFGTIRTSFLAAPGRTGVMIAKAGLRRAALADHRLVHLGADVPAGRDGAWTRSRRGCLRHQRRARLATALGARRPRRPVRGVGSRGRRAGPPVCRRHRDPAALAAAGGEPVPAVRRVRPQRAAVVAVQCRQRVRQRQRGRGLGLGGGTTPNALQGGLVFAGTALVLFVHRPGGGQAARRLSPPPGGGDRRVQRFGRARSGWSGRLRSARPRSAAACRTLVSISTLPPGASQPADLCGDPPVHRDAVRAAVEGGGRFVQPGLGGHERDLRRSVRTARWPPPDPAGRAAGPVAGRTGRRNRWACAVGGCARHRPPPPGRCRRRGTRRPDGSTTSAAATAATPQQSSRTTAGSASAGRLDSSRRPSRTSSSLRRRGTKTPGATAIRSPRNDAQPRTCSSGSPATRRAVRPASAGGIVRGCQQQCRLVLGEHTPRARAVRRPAPTPGGRGWCSLRNLDAPPDHPDARGPAVAFTGPGHRSLGRCIRTRPSPANGSSVSVPRTTGCPPTSAASSASIRAAGGSTRPATRLGRARR